MTIHPLSSPIQPRSPQGRFNLGGTNSKASGPDHPCVFTKAKSVAEKL
jgi:hypothetical protein